jgi:hypothetical protein
MEPAKRKALGVYRVSFLKQRWTAGVWAKIGHRTKEDALFLPGQAPPSDAFRKLILVEFLEGCQFWEIIP